MSLQLKKSGYSIEPVMHILEIGFGSGKFLTYAQNLGANIVGAEMNDDLVSMGKRADLMFTTQRKF